MLSRRRLVAASAAGLTLGVLPRGAGAQAVIPALELIEPLGEPSVIWTAFSFLQPVLEAELGCPVTVRSITGRDNLVAAEAVLAGDDSAVRLLGGAVMAMQYAARATDHPLDVEGMTPIAKLSNGFSMALFAKAGGGLARWEDAAARAAGAPLRLSCLPLSTAAWVARLMIERTAGLPLEVTVRETIGEVVADVTAGTCEAGLIPTALVARDRANLTALATFGAERNAVLQETPTFGEVTGNWKNTFTESIAAFGPPDMDAAVAARLTAAFVAAGQTPEILGTQESTLFPVVVNGPEVLVETMARNHRVLDEILA